MTNPDDAPLDGSPDWYKDAVIYEVHVRAFHDSDGDGIGDFQGLIDKLDYLVDLGVTALWLLPFYPSPGRDDGYDIADYMTIKESFGTMKDFRRLLREAHRRGLRVITELVINHTSSEHAWFQRARKAKPGTRARDFYVWSDTPDKYNEARIIFQDFETSNWTWDPVAQAYYWHRFYGHQPDLNFENPDVHAAVLKVFDHWMKMGVDGMRLDAIPYLYEREGTNCENLPETHDFLKKLRAHIDDNFSGRMLLAEANQWPEDAAAYFGDGDECHMNFHFPLMPRMFMALRMENSFPIVDIMRQTPAIPESSQWALFLRNHDELTLEMVTDEDRDYMYRVYAEDRQARVNLGIRRRLAPLLEERKKIELMNGLLFSMPGTPVIYYGDEIGMGDNIYLGDRDSVRTPMQWSADRNGGFSRANPQKLYLPVIIDPEYHFESVNVEAQSQNPASLLWWMKRIITLRKEHRVFGRGTIEFLHPDNAKVLAFLRRGEGETILVVANLSRFAQYVELDLREYEGRVPVELFGRTQFPEIGELPYLLTLGPHTFYWFALTEEGRVGADGEGAPIPENAEDGELPVLEAGDRWDNLVGKRRRRLENRLMAWVPRRRWFRSKSQEIKRIRVAEDIPFSTDEGTVHILVLDVETVEGSAGRYVLPVAFAQGERAEHFLEWSPEAVIARVETEGPRGSTRTGVLFDALVGPAFPRALLRSLTKRNGRARSGDASTSLASTALEPLRKHRDQLDTLEPHLSGAEQTNTTVVFGHDLVMKVFRRLEEGINPELEMGRYLTQEARYPNVPPVCADFELRRRGQAPAAFGIVQEFVDNQGDAWRFSLEAMDRSFERAISLPNVSPPPAPSALLDRVDAEPDDDVADVIGPFLALIERLGTRTAQLHLALARETVDPDFAPEVFTTLQQRSVYQSSRSLLGQTFRALHKTKHRLDDPALRELLNEVLGQEDDLDARLRRLLDRKLECVRTRTHGDLHLGQVLATGDDFVFIDFEGEPARSLGERRLKRSPVRDVAGLIRSFDYVGAASLRSGRVRNEDVERMAPWARAWSDWSSASFFRAYLETADGAAFLPADRADLSVMLDFYLLDKCIYEVRYELDHRPDWLGIPLSTLNRMLQEEPR